MQKEVKTLLALLEMIKKDYAVSILVVSPKGTPLIRDFAKPAPVYWKLPGGRSLSDESPEDCAIRELKEETGLEVVKESLRKIYEEDRTNHTFILYRTDLKDLPEVKSDDDGEEVFVFSSGDIISLPDLFPPHREILKDILF